MAQTSQRDWHTGSWQAAPLRLLMFGAPSAAPALGCTHARLQTAPKDSRLCRTYGIGQNNESDDSGSSSSSPPECCARPGRFGHIDCAEVRAPDSQFVRAVAVFAPRPVRSKGATCGFLAPGCASGQTE